MEIPPLSRFPTFIAGGFIDPGIQGKSYIGGGTMEMSGFYGSRPPSDQVGDGSKVEDDLNFVEHG